MKLRIILINVLHFMKLNKHIQQIRGLSMHFIQRNLKNHGKNVLQVCLNCTIKFLILRIRCGIFQCPGSLGLHNSLGKGISLTLLYKIFPLKTFIHHNPHSSKLFNLNNNNFNCLPHQINLVLHNFLPNQCLTLIIKPSNPLTTLDWSLIPLFLPTILHHSRCRIFFLCYRNFVCRCKKSSLDPEKW